MSKAKQAEIGDNSGDVNAGHLRAFIERLEVLNEEKKALSEDIAEVYAEIKSTGLDPKIIRKVLALRKMDPGERAEQEALIELYTRALGQLVDTPLGRAALERVSA